MSGMTVDAIDDNQERGLEKESDWLKLPIQWVQTGLNWMLFFPGLPEFVIKLVPRALNIDLDFSL